MVSIRNTRVNLDFVASQLEEAKSGSGERVVFSAPEMREMSAILATSLDFSQGTPDTERQRIINQAIFYAGQSGKITKRSLLGAISRFENEYLELPTQTFTLVTTLSVRYGDYLRPQRADDAVIVFSAAVPKRFDRSPLEEIPHWPKNPDPKDYTIVRVSVNARSKYESFDRAITALDFFRGLWNFSLNRGTISRWSTGGKRPPINDIRLGPFHTIHKANGKVEQEVFWFQTQYEELPAANLGRDWKRLASEAQVIRKRLRVIPYRQFMHEIFVRYARALDSSDFESCFLRLWSLFELLTHTSVGARYDQTIERTLFIFRERELNRALLEHLRGHRNATIHQGASSEQVESFTWQLKRYVDELIRFHILWSGRFQSMEEVGAFLDLPHDPLVIRSKIKQLRMALKYRGS
jgi:hypothetical protein